MAITNQDKPNTSSVEAHLNIGSGFNLLVGGIYKLIIGAAGTGGMTNADKVSFAELWSTITTTWDSETRNWDECVSLFHNLAMSLTDPLWSSRTFPWTLTLPWQTTANGISNVNKPS